ncbi:MAG: glycosyltransferase [Methylophilales bacterium]|nr:glycosyltransferase [Methylophilales bacterium]
MRILMVSDVYFPRINGVSTSIQTFRRELRALGHTVHLIAPDYHSPSDDESDILRVPARSVPRDPEDRFMRFNWVMEHLGELRSEFYDIIHIQTPFVAHYLGLKLSRNMRIPCVETYHTFFEEYLYHYVPFLPKSLMRMAARNFSRHQGNSLNGMVIPSQPMLDALREYGVSSHAEVIPTGLEPESFVPGDKAAFRTRYNIPLDRPMMLFVGRVAHEKNIGFLLDVVEQVRKTTPDVLLVIAGEGPARNGLEKEVITRHLSSNVTFLGYLDRRTELNHCYASADVFVFASRTETQGLVLLEAMAQSVPVVALAEMGTKDVLREGEGVRIAQNNIIDFASKVAGLLTDEHARKELGAKGTQYAHTWSANSLALRLAAFYESIIGQYNSR